MRHAWYPMSTVFTEKSVIRRQCGVFWRAIAHLEDQYGFVLYNFTVHSADYKYLCTGVPSSEPGCFFLIARFLVIVVKLKYEWLAH